MTFYDQPGRDGRRKSDPLQTPNSSPAEAPAYQLWRHVAANDAAAGSDANLELPAHAGVNFADYSVGVLQVVQRGGPGLDDAPGGSGAVVISVYEWSPGAGKFIPTGETKTGGAGESFPFRLNVDGRLLYFHVAELGVGESVSLYVSGSADGASG